MKYLSWGHSRNFEPKFLPTGMCSASQIVSHTLRVWRINQWQMQDFPDGCGAGGGANLLCGKILAENCMKIKENWTERERP